MEEEGDQARQQGADDAHGSEDHWLRENLPRRQGAVLPVLGFEEVDLRACCFSPSQLSQHSTVQPLEEGLGHTGLLGLRKDEGPEGILRGVQGELLLQRVELLFDQGGSLGGSSVEPPECIAHLGLCRHPCPRVGTAQAMPLFYLVAPHLEVAFL